jgi:phage terminase large subunit-like protein
LNEQAEKALETLQSRFSSPKAALEAVQALRKKRFEEQFVLYWDATPAQKPLFKSFDKKIKVFGILGGNRSGKTEIGTFIDVAWALGKKAFEGEPAWEFIENLPIPEPPNNIWVVGLDFPTLRDVIWGEKFRRGRNHPPLVPELSPYVKKLNDSDFQIFFKNGSVITGKSADSGREKFQGASVDLVHIDEECEADVFDECYQRTSDCAGKLLITLTPLTDIASGVRTPWVHDLYKDAERGLKKDVKFVRLSVLDNPYVPADEKDKLKVKWAGHPEEKARLYGDFVQRSGLVYPMWSPAIHMVKRRKLPDVWRKVVSIDPAATGTTAAVWGAIEPGTNNLYLTDEYYESGKVPSDHAKGMLVRNGARTVDIWLIDPVWGNQREPSDHKTGAQLYRDSGIPARLAEVDSDFGVLASLEYMNATLEPTSRHPKVYVFDDLYNFRKEIEGYVWASFDRGDRQGLSKEKPIKRNDHLMNAFQYLCAGKFKSTIKVKASLEDRQKAVAVNSYT